ncbi:MAG: pyruvate formate-lyase-activating protein [Clostridia bacterium]
MKKGYINSLESFATFEGAGIRLAIFMQGCNLRCAYCHNPDTWTPRTNEVVTSEDLLKKALRYKPYFKNGGGVTFTGGEPLLQADFLIETVKLLKENGINTAIDTSCSLLNDSVKELYSLCELVIADLKYPDNSRYTAKCGMAALDKVVESLRFLEEKNIPVWLRTVIVPNDNDTEKDILAYYNIIKDFKNIKKYELLPFHTMGFKKYTALGINNPLEGLSALPNERLTQLKAYLAKLATQHNPKN